MKRPYLLPAVLLVLAVAAGVFWGQVGLFPLNEDSRAILWNFRLPRVAFAAINGAMLALAGVLYQIALRNPLADGFTTGAASSAALGGCLALIAWGPGAMVPLCAILCAALGISLVRRVSGLSGAGEKDGAPGGLMGGLAGGAGGSGITVILAGIALSVVAGAGISFLKYFFEESIGAMVFWLMGGLGGATWTKAAVLLAVLLPAFIALWLHKNRLALLFLDDHSAATSGADVQRLRELLFMLTTVLVALSVSFCGVIGFLGLMIPHAARGLLGHNITAQLAGAPLLGAAALTLFDLLARTALPHGGELPVGIVTSLAGGVFFFILILRKGNTVWGR